MAKKTYTLRQRPSFAVRFGESRQKDEAFGVTVGGTAHKTLLAMRACGRIEVNQLT